MIAAANDLADVARVPVAHCGACQHWGEYAPSGRRSVQFGQCFVHRGPLPVYTAANAACSVCTSGVKMWRPVAGPTGAA